MPKAEFVVVEQFAPGRSERTAVEQFLVIEQQPAATAVEQLLVIEQQPAATAVEQLFVIKQQPAATAVEQFFGERSALVFVFGGDLIRFSGDG